jgi:hypothetical protein
MIIVIPLVLLAACAAIFWTIFRTTIANTFTKRVSLDMSTVGIIAVLFSWMANDYSTRIPLGGLSYFPDQHRSIWEAAQGIVAAFLGNGSSDDRGRVASMLSQGSMISGFGGSDF